MFKSGLKVSAAGLLLTMFIAFSIWGFYNSPFSISSLVSEIKFETEYTNGLLTVSGILFGIWAIILSERSRIENDSDNLTYTDVVLPSFYLSLGLLILSVTFLTMTGVGWYSPIFLFFFIALSCVINVSLLAHLFKWYPKTRIKKSIRET